MAGGRVDKENPTRFGQAIAELGVWCMNTLTEAWLYIMGNAGWEFMTGQEV